MITTMVTTTTIAKPAPAANTSVTRADMTALLSAKPSRRTRIDSHASAR
jgi:hypothetical protein